MLCLSISVLNYNTAERIDQFKWKLGITISDEVKIQRSNNICYGLKNLYKSLHCYNTTSLKNNFKKPQPSSIFIFLLPSFLFTLFPSFSILFFLFLYFLLCFFQTLLPLFVKHFCVLVDFCQVIDDDCPQYNGRVTQNKSTPPPPEYDIDVD